MWMDFGLMSGSKGRGERKEGEEQRNIVKLKRSIDGCDDVVIVFATFKRSSLSKITLAIGTKHKEARITVVVIERKVLQPLFV